MFFENWSNIWRTLVVGVLAYLALVVLLRITGKRTLSKMNAFDLVVTVALGSTLASVLTSQRVTLAQGVTAFAVLIGMQLIVTWMAVRSSIVARAIKSEPRLIVHNGAFLPQAMKRERVLEDEVLAAIRSQGVAQVEDVVAIVLETDGTFSVISGEGKPTSLQNLDAQTQSRS